MMRIDTIEALMQAMRTLYPVTFTDSSMPMWTERYRSALGHLSADELNAAWDANGKIYKKKAAPSPAELLAALGASAPKSSRNTQRTAAEMHAAIHKRDADIREARHAIEDRYRADKPNTFARAEAERWIGLLTRQVQTAANIIAQRDQARKDGKDVKPLSEQERADYCIASFGDSDQIEITQANIAIWRDWLSTPAKRISNNIPKMNFAGEAA